MSTWWMSGGVRARVALFLGSVETEQQLFRQHGACPERYLYHIQPRTGNQTLRSLQASTQNKTKCRKCGGDVQMLCPRQRRSVDEGFTAYFMCKQCSARWSVDT